MMRFQKSPILKPFLKVSIFISIFGCFSVEDSMHFQRKTVGVVCIGHQNSTETTGYPKPVAGVYLTLTFLSSLIAVA